MKTTNLLKASLTFISLSIAYLSIGQSLSCLNPSGNYTRPDSVEHCKGSSGGNFNQHWLDRIAAQGGMSVAGIKSSIRKRSVFVNERINGLGGFAVFKDKNSSSDPTTPDADGVGSTFAIDTDGDCVYEREDALLEKLKFNLFDEIILYNVSAILEIGQDTLKSGVGSKNTYINQLAVNQTAEWHLARFIDKAKGMNFNVVAVVPEGDTLDYKKFYNFHTSNAENWGQFDSYIEEINQAYFEQYIDLWLYNPELVTYKTYGEDTLFLPKDGNGRIADIDKYIVDMYNFAVFQMRAEKGYITKNNSSDPCSYDVSKGCKHAFDAHFAEMEWWDNSNSSNAEDDYIKLKGVMYASHGYRNSGFFNCYPELYVAQNQVDKPTSWSTWTSLSPQQRADTVDSLADRVYIYAYQRVPCDCYWGRSNDSTLNQDQNDWFVKAEYFYNNSFPTDLYPVFNAKFYDSTLFISNAPFVYNDGNYGCNSISNKCDYCYNRVGDAMRQLPPSADIIKLGYVENTWQEQYDFDPNNSSSTVRSNIHGYAWFKSSVLDGAGVINSDKSIEQFEVSNKAFLFPNPSSGELQIIGDDAIESVQVFDLSGRIVLNLKNLSTRRFSLKNSGTYIVKIKTDDEILTQKIVITK